MPSIEERLANTAPAPTEPVAPRELMRRAQRRTRARRIAGALTTVTALVAVLAVAQRLPSSTVRFEEDPSGAAAEQAALPEVARLQYSPSTSAQPAQLDGTPVWITTVDGKVFVVAAVLADGIRGPEPALWCQPARAFVTPRGASIFDADGGWLTGPAPHGLPSAPARRVGEEQIMVTAPLEAEPRPSDVGRSGPRHDACFADGEVRSDLERHPQVAPDRSSGGSG